MPYPILPNPMMEHDCIHSDVTDGADMVPMTL
jgi:hypothetical protein